jgi:hypothetical protein
MARPPFNAGNRSQQGAPADIAVLAAFVKPQAGRNSAESTWAALPPAKRPSHWLPPRSLTHPRIAVLRFSIEIGNQCDLSGHSGDFFARSRSLSQTLILQGSIRHCHSRDNSQCPHDEPHPRRQRAHVIRTPRPRITKSQISLFTPHDYHGNRQSPKPIAAILATPGPLSSAICPLSIRVPGILVFRIR